jgi:hypothetical protein
MPENEIYKFLKENNLTSKDEASFTKEYSNPEKAQELHKFMLENELTDKDSATFYETYFNPEVKKKEESKPTVEDFNKKYGTSYTPQEFGAKVNSQSESTSTSTSGTNKPKTVEEFNAKYQTNYTDLATGEKKIGSAEKSMLVPFTPIKVKQQSTLEDYITPTTTLPDLNKAPMKRYENAYKSINSRIDTEGKKFENITLEIEKKGPEVEKGLQQFENELKQASNVIQKELMAKYQPMVDNRKMTKEQADAQFKAEYDKGFNVAQAEITKKYAPTLNNYNKLIENRKIIGNGIKTDVERAKLLANSVNIIDRNVKAGMIAAEDNMDNAVQSGLHALGSILAGTLPYSARMLNNNLEEYALKNGMPELAKIAYAKQDEFNKSELYKAMEDQAKESAKKSQYYSQKIEEKEGTVLDNFEAGNYGKAAKVAGIRFAESIPVMAAAIGMTALTRGNVIASIPIGGFVFGSQNYYGEYADRMDMSESDKLGASYIKGSLEMATEVSILPILSPLKNLLKTAGKEAAKEAVKKTLFGTIKAGYEKYLPAFGWVQEGASEYVNELAATITDKLYDPKFQDKDWGTVIKEGHRRGLEAFGPGAFGGAAFTLPTLINNGLNKYNSKLEARGYEKELSQIDIDIANPTLPVEAKNILIDRKKELHEKLNKTFDADKQDTAGATTEQLSLLDDINDRRDVIQNALLDETLTPESKKAFEEDIKKLESEERDVLDQIKANEVVDEKEKAKGETKFYQGIDFNTQTGLRNGDYTEAQVAEARLNKINERLSKFADSEAKGEVLADSNPKEKQNLLDEKKKLEKVLEKGKAEEVVNEKESEEQIKARKERISQIQGMLASDNLSMQEKGGAILLPEARQELLAELEKLTKETKNVLANKEVDVEKQKKLFTEAGEQSKKDQSPKALGNFIVDNAQVGDRIVLNEDSYYEVVSRKISKRNGSTEVQLQNFVRNEETGEFENNPSAVKFFSDKRRGTDLEKLDYRDASDLFENSYTNAKAERITEQSTYEPKTNKQNDKENITGVQSNQREGQEPKQTQPNENTSKEEISASGNVQTHEEEVVKPAPKTVKVFRTTGTGLGAFNVAHRGSGTYYALDKPFQALGRNGSVEELEISIDEKTTLDLTVDANNAIFSDIQNEAKKRYEKLEESKRNQNAFNDLIRDVAVEKGYTGIISYIEPGAPVGEREKIGREYVSFKEAEPANKQKTTKQNEKSNKQSTNEANGQVMLEGVRQTGNENEGRKSSEQLREEEVGEPKAYAEATDAYKATELGSSEDAKNKKQALVEQAETEEGKKFVESEISKLEKNEDGTITVFRSGTMQEGHNPVTTSRKTAEIIASERKKQGLSSDIIEIKVDPSDISVVVKGIENEVFVKVDKNNKERIDKNTLQKQKNKTELLANKEQLQKELDEAKETNDRINKAFNNGTFKFGENVFKDADKKQKAKIKNLEWQISKIDKAIEQSSTEQSKSIEDQIKDLRAEEQAELDAKIPNAEKYRVNGRVDSKLLTNPEDIVVYEETYEKYNKPISDLLAKQDAEKGKETPKAKTTTEEKPIVTEEIINNALKNIKENGKPLSEFKVGDKVIIASDYDSRYDTYTEGVVVKAGEQYEIQRFPESPNFKKYKIANFSKDTLAVLKPKGEPNYGGEGVLWKNKEQAKTPVKAEENASNEQMEAGKEQLEAIKEGKTTTTSPVRLFKGLEGKKTATGEPLNAHPDAEGVFSSVDEKEAERYKGEAGVAMFDIPAGTTIEVVKLNNPKVSFKEARRLETEAINASDAQIVKLITSDAKGTEEQYIIKDKALIAKMQKPAPVEKVKATESEAVKAGVLPRIKNAFLKIGTEIFDNAKALMAKAKELAGEGAKIDFSMTQAIDQAKDVKLEYNDVREHLAPNGEPSNLTEEQAKIVRTPAFKEWAGKNWENVLKDENGEPKVFYHGTTNDFTVFDSTVKGNKQGQLGQMNYFTSSRSDAERNYLSGGPDLISRIKGMAESMEYDIEDLTDEELSEKYGVDKKEFESIEDLREKAKKIAELKLLGNQERILPVFIKSKKPITLGKKSTWINTIEISDEDIATATQEVADDYSVTEEEARDEYDYEIRERAIQNSGAENVVVEALEKALRANGYDSSKASEILGDNFYETEIDLNEIEKSLREAELYDNNMGEMASSQVISDMFKNLGYDSIILDNVSDRFKNMGLSKEDSHVHVFDENNNNIKLADGTNTTFDSNTSDIRYNITMPDGTQKQVKIVDADVVNGFYSPLEAIINGVKQDKMPAKQWIEKFAKGEEAKWTGLTDWLSSQPGSVSKADIQNYLKDNRIEIVEVVKSEDGTGTNESVMNDTKYSQYQLEGEKENYKEILVTLPSRYSEKERSDAEDKGIMLPVDKTQFRSSHYVEPNILVHLRMNTRTDSQGNKVLFLEEIQSDWGQEGKRRGFEKPEDTQAIKELEDEKQKVLDSSKSYQLLNENTEGNLSVEVFDAIQQVASRNIDDKYYTKESRKERFLKDIENTLSYWEKYEYVVPNMNQKELSNFYDVYIKELENNSERISGYSPSYQLASVENKLSDINTKIFNLSAKEGVKTAPFVMDTNAWAKLGLKVALKEAVKQGVDKIAWTTGEQQNERYNLKKDLNHIDYWKNDNGTYGVILDFKTPQEFTKPSELTERELSDYFGKEIATKIVSDTSSPTENNPKRLEGDDLSVGGKGMKGFYGSPTEGSLGIVGNVAKSLTKQDVGMVNILSIESGEKFINDDYEIRKDETGYYIYDTNLESNVRKSQDEGWATKEAADRWARGISEDAQEEFVTQHSIDITPELKATVEQGQPLFHYGPKGEILGFTHNGKIYLNGEKITAKTTMEEAGHVWVNWAKENRADLHKAGLDKIAGSQYLADVMADKNYQAEALKVGKKGSKAYNLYMAEEALAKAIADEGAKFVTESKKADFKQWLVEIWKAVAKEFGIRDLSPKQISKLTLEQFAKKVAADVFNEEPAKAKPVKKKGKISPILQRQINKVDLGRMSPTERVVLDLIGNLKKENYLEHGKDYSRKTGVELEKNGKKNNDAYKIDNTNVRLNFIRKDAKSSIDQIVMGMMSELGVEDYDIQQVINDAIDIIESTPVNEFLKKFIPGKNGLTTEEQEQLDYINENARLLREQELEEIAAYEQEVQNYYESMSVEELQAIENDYNALEELLKVEEYGKQEANVGEQINSQNNESQSRADSEKEKAGLQEKVKVATNAYNAALQKVSKAKEALLKAGQEQQINLMGVAPVDKVLFGTDIANLTEKVKKLQDLADLAKENLNKAKTELDNFVPYNQETLRFELNEGFASAAAKLTAEQEAEIADLKEQLKNTKLPSQKAKIMAKIAAIKGEQIKSAASKASQANKNKTVPAPTVPLTKKETKALLFNFNLRIKEILNSIGVPVAEGRLSKKYLGMFYFRNKSIRVQSLFGVATACHEAAHYISDKFGIGKAIMNPSTIAKENPNAAINKDIRKALTDIYVEYYPGAKETHSLRLRIEEGIAVLLERYLVDPSGIFEKYGLLVDNFINPTGLYYNEMFTDLLGKLNEVFSDYASLTPLEKIGTRIARGKEVLKQDTGFTIAQRNVFNWVYNGEPLRRADRTAGVQYKDESAEIAHIRWSRRAGLITPWVTGDVDSYLLTNKGWVKSGLSVKQYLTLIKGQEAEFSSYLIARRNVEDVNYQTQLQNDLIELLEGINDEELSEKEIEKLLKKAEKLQAKLDYITNVIKNNAFDIEVARQAVEQNEARFKEAASIFDKINEAMTEFAHTTGILSAEKLAEYKNVKGYASNKRLTYDDIENTVQSNGSNSQNRIGAFKPREGSSKSIVDPVYSQIQFITETMSKGLQNTVWQNLAKLGNNNVELARRFELQTTAPLFDPQTGKISYPQMKDKALITVWNNGKPSFYLAGPEYLAFAETMTSKEFEAFGAILKEAATLFSRFTTTAYPLFPLVNIPIDTISAWMNTKTGFVPVLSQLSSLKDMTRYGLDYVSRLIRVEKWYNSVKNKKIGYLLRDDLKMFEKYLSLGGSLNNLSAYYDMTPEEMIKAISTENVLKKGYKNVKNATLGLLELPGNMSENLTRFAEFKKAKEKGYSDDVAMYMAAHVSTPFIQQGNMGGRVGQTIEKSIPYFHSALQVLGKYGQQVKEDPIRVATITAGMITIAMASVLATLAYSDDDDKKVLAEQTTDQLSKNIHFPKALYGGKGFVKIRIPESLGQFTGAMTMAILQQKELVKKYTVKDWLTATTVAIPTQLNITKPFEAIWSWQPQLLKPSVEVISNTKAYPELAPIVNEGLARKLAKYEYNQYTSLYAKELGELTNMSPILIEHFVKAQFGKVPDMLLDWGTEVVTGQAAPKKSMINIESKDFILRGRAFNEFYANSKAWNEKRSSIKDIKAEDGDTEGLKMNAKTFEKTKDLISLLQDKIKEGKEIPSDMKNDLYELLENLNNSENPREFNGLRSALYIKALEL